MAVPLTTFASHRKRLAVAMVLERYWPQWDQPRHTKPEMPGSVALDPRLL